MKTTRVLSHFLVALDDVVYGTVEDRRYLLLPALVGYQSVQNLLPDGLFVVRREAFFSPLLKWRQVHA
jgi:hypothetical protein